MKRNDFNVDDVDIDNFKIEKEKLKLITIVCLISTAIIEIIHNININLYIRDFIVPIAVMLCGYIYIIRNYKLAVKKNAYILLIPIVLILLSNLIIKVDISNKFLNIFILPILLSVFFFMLINKNYKVSKESLNWIFKLFPKNLFNNLKSLRNMFDSQNHSKTKTILNVLIGSIVGIPIAIVILLLLANADKYFSKFISFILNFVSMIFHYNFLLNNVLTIVIAFILLFSIFINILRHKNDKVKAAVYRDANITTSSTILIIINAVFVLFLISEVSKLTVNFLQLPIRYTYAQYAREGFFQLLVVTSINFIIITYYVYYTKIIKSSSFIKKMLLLLITFSIVLIFNSYYRMFLYICAYGFTVLRLQVILFLAMELVLFIIFIRKILNKLIHTDYTLFMIILIIFYILNIYLCTNGFAKLLNTF